jgi:hypothetical protein
MSVATVRLNGSSGFWVTVLGDAVRDNPVRDDAVLETTRFWADQGASKGE